MKRERALAYIAFAIVCIVWGTTYLAIRVAVRSIPPFLLDLKAEWKSPGPDTLGVVHLGSYQNTISVE